MRRTARALSTTATAVTTAAVLGTAASAAIPAEERVVGSARERATLAADEWAMAPAQERAKVPADESATGPARVPEEDSADPPPPPIPDEEPSGELAEKPVDEWAEEPPGGSGEESADKWAKESAETSAGASAAAPAAEVSPRTVAPGGTVTVSVSCGPLGGTAPKSIDAHSQAFEHGTAKLHLVKGKGKDEDEAAGPAYRGTARIAPASHFKDGGPDKAGPTSEWSVDGTCPAPPGAEEAEWSATFTVSRDGSRHPHGVRAGEGGAFTDSPAALAAGGLLIAGALGAGVHKLLRRESSVNR
ncbi:hypothetical protein [Streptomyces yerevanensis]|uniref:hypothetical protein n=1 Tax=Streptomyces yerevanensis TaxID=66378 RepID=UPI000A55457C